MSFSFSTRVFCLSLLLGFGSAAYVRDLPFSNQTTTAIATATQTDSASLSSTPLTADSPSLRTINAPHIEISVTTTTFGTGYVTDNGHGFQNFNSTTSEVASTTTFRDIGSILKSLLTLPARIEATATGLGSHPTDKFGQSTAEPTTSTDAAFRQHVESSAGDLNGEEPFTQIGSGSEPVATPAPVTFVGQTLHPTSATKIVIGSTTAEPGQTITIGNGPSATLVEVGPSGQPEYVVGSVTYTPALVPTTSIIIGDETAVPIASGLIIEGQTVVQGGSAVTVGPSLAPFTVSISSNGDTVAVQNGVTSTFLPPATSTFSIGQTIGTLITDAYQYALGASTLVVGQAITIGSAIISVTTDSSGSTVLISGGSSTTLAAPAQATAGDELSILTTVVSGTTEYIVDSQTLFPGHPITLSGTPITIATVSGSTVLVVGSVTSSFADLQATTMASLVGTTLNAEASSAAKLRTTSATSAKPTSGAGMQRVSLNIVVIGVLSALIVLLGLG